MHKPTMAGRRARAVATAAATAVAAALLTVAGGSVAAQAAAPHAVAPLRGAVTAGGLVTGTSCSPSCSLYAKAGTLTVGASTLLPVWNFTDGDTAVTGTSPVIVATTGTAVSITLTNSLAVPVTLSIPGLTGFSADYTGIAPGASTTYGFTPTRPGTFIYQAGHVTTAGANDPGPREAAMGLAGALVVRPAAAPNQDLSVAAPPSAFDDEAVLVLTEIDPTFAANPMQADLRNFSPTYRLINGTAWPTTTQIGTTGGHKVLLRYVNAGVGSASMGVLGGLKQTVVADNGYPADGTALVADTLAAGDTEDVIVTVPSAGGNFPVVDTSGRLDTNGLVDGSTNKMLAFGGRMTMISTTGGVGGTGTDPGGDIVGPNTTNLALSPNPATVGVTVTLAGTFTDPTVTVGANTYGPNAVTAAEYTLDPTVAAGAGIAFTTVTAGTTAGTATGSVAIPATALAGKSGAVKVYVRARDSIGNWGPTATVTLNIPNGGPTVSGLTATPSLTNGTVDVKITATGDDSLIGSTISTMTATLNGVTYLMTIATPGAVVSATATIPASAILALVPDGSYPVTVTATDGLALTGSGTVALKVDTALPTASGTALDPATANNGTLGSVVDPTSIKVSSTFSDSASGGSTIVAAEGFFNSTAAPAASAYGTGFVWVASDGSFNSATETAYGLVPLSELTALPDGPVQIWVHGKDAAGNWGTPVPVTLQVDRTRPTVSALTSTQVAGGPGRLQLTYTVANPGTGASALTAAEYFLGTSDPGAGNGTAIANGFAVGSNTVTANDIPLGSQTIFVRVRDAAGNWSVPVSTTRTVLTEPIFSDTFGTANFGNSGNSNAWAARSTGANAPTYPLASSAGTGWNTRFVMLTANNSGASNVTTPTMTGTTNPAATAYYARFLFRPNTLSITAAGQVNILTLRSGTTVRGAVQYRVNAGNRQIRAVNNGAAAATWYTLPNGPSSTYTIRVTWIGGAGGSMVVTVNGVAASSVVTGGVNGQTVNNAVLGTSAPTGAITGQAYFDYYTASRFGAPA